MADITITRWDKKGDNKPSILQHAHAWMHVLGRGKVSLYLDGELFDTSLALQKAFEDEAFANASHRLKAGYMLGYYYIQCSDGVRLADLQQVLGNGYRIHGTHGLLIKRR